MAGKALGVIVSAGLILVPARPSSPDIRGDGFRSCFTRGVNSVTDHPARRHLPSSFRFSDQLGDWVLLPPPGDSVRLASVLVFSRTVGYRHDSIPAGSACLKRIADRRGWSVSFTEDPAAFSPENLSRFNVVVFLMSRGDVLGPAEEAAFQGFIRSGKGCVGVHTGAITENDWPWFVELAGGKFIGHPVVQEARVVIEDRNHPAVPAGLGAEWLRVDEWYSFDRNPRTEARVLMSVDESSYDFGEKAGEPRSKLRMGDHPIVWCREYDGGRIFMTALGHGAECYEDPLFVAHLEGAILWSAGRGKPG